uniref:Uncharacterized protein n=1 Tax=Sphaerodactylus townsendi TaxID=933632 RepID=A0ACB8EA94_9SAUR
MLTIPEEGKGKDGAPPAPAADSPLGKGRKQPTGSSLSCHTQRTEKACGVAGLSSEWVESLGQKPAQLLTLDKSLPLCLSYFAGQVLVQNAALNSFKEGPSTDATNEGVNAKGGSTNASSSHSFISAGLCPFSQRDADGRLCAAVHRIQTNSGIQSLT